MAQLPSKEDKIIYNEMQGAIDDSHSKPVTFLDKNRLRLLTREPTEVIFSPTSPNTMTQFVSSIIELNESWQANFSLKQPQELLSGSAKAYEVFFCYSYSLKDNPLREQLETHLRIMQRQLRQQLRLIITLHNGEVGAGKAWKQEIERHLTTAHIILLLVSPDFLDSDFCRNIEMKQALKRHESGKACVIPVILRPCNWKGEKFGHLQALPNGDKAVTKWTNRDEAFAKIATGIQAAIVDLIKKPYPKEMP